MAIVNEIKCARCDRKYSGVRSRCPYCGARRIGRGKYSEESDNAKGKMIISVLIMAVIAVAAGILLFSTPVDAPEIPVETPSMNNPEDDINSLPSLPTPTPSPSPEPPPVIQQQITSMRVSMTGSDRVLGGADNNFTLSSRNGGESLGIRAKIEPLSLDWEKFDIQFVSSNEDVFTATPTHVGAGAGDYGATLKWTGSGTARLTVIATYDNQEPMEWTVTVHGGR